MFALFSTSLFFGQTPSGISINWNVEVGCQTFSEDIRDEKNPILIEDIADGNCIKVCERGIVTYTLSGTLGLGTTQWTVLGGIISSQTNTTCTVTWGNVGAGSLSFVVNSTNGIVNKTICFDKIIKPIALFNVIPNISPNKVIYGCINQAINFTNLSNTNGGTGIVTYFWDFGDGQFSSANSPSHTYYTNGLYNVTLIVTNACNCTSVYKRPVSINSTGFDISCPTVVCEGASSVYTLPFDANQICNNFTNNWTAIGGLVSNVNPLNGSATVIWNNVDSNGFGYLTFDSTSCEVSCLIPSTIKVPVVQSIGTIIGNANLCLGEQSIYKLPQWPDTTFNWEVVANVANNLATLIQSSQRNEVIVQPNIQGTIVLRATYYNNLLHCGGTATFTINVSKPINFTGDSQVCLNNIGNYTTGSTITTWVLKNSTGTVITTLSNNINFSYNFTTIGAYVLSVGGSGSCAGQQMNINVVALPINPILNDIKVLMPNGILDSATTTLICPNTPYNYSAPIDLLADYQWTITNGTINGSTTGNQISATFNGALPAELKYYKVSPAPLSCRSPLATVTIPVRQINVTIASLGFTYNNNTNVCANKYVKYQANITGTSNLYTEGETYTWAITPANLGSIVTGQNTSQIEILWNNVLASSQATISLVVNKCTITATALPSLITIVPLPTIVINPVASTCSGTAINFTVTATSGFTLAPGTVVTWNFGSADVIGGTSINNTFSNTVGTTNITKNVTATILNPNGCLGTITAQLNVVILPGPPATASLTTTANAFCLQSQISATLAVSSSMTGVSIQWYKNGILIPFQIGSQLFVTSSAATGFGDYTFKATKTTAPFCATFSNPVSIVQFCTQPEPCAIVPTPVVVNNVTQSCSVLNLNWTATPGFSTRYWTVFGPNISLIGYTAPTCNVTKAGVYQTIITAEYPLSGGGVCKYQNLKNITVPYVADFKYNAVCNGNNSFNLNFVDNSSFFAVGITSPTVKFFYKLASTSVWTGPITGTAVNNLPAGNYNLKTEIRANYLGVLQPICTKTLNISLTTVPLFNITVLPVLCHDTSVKFSTSDLSLTNTYLWHFENGAESTLKETERVFSTVGLQNVWVDITNQFGCTRRIYTTVNVGGATTVIVPPRCFNGMVVSNPANATVCSGSPFLTLTYQPVAGDCAVNTYTWMNGQTPVTPAVNAATIQVTNPGFYWVNVKTNTLCSYDTTNRIIPVFKPLPNLKLTGPSTICLGNSINASITTNAMDINWFFDGVAQPIYNNLKTFSVNNFVVGNHTILVTVTLNGCTTSTSQVVTIYPTPDVPVITQIVACAPEPGGDPLYPYYHVTLTATSNVPGVFNWSNGATGPTIVVTDGGPIQVRITSGGCSNTAQVDVPYNPERFMWIFPSGCQTNCFDRNNTITIIGPHQIFPSWEWLQNNNVIGSGLNSEPTPLIINNSGTYNLNLNNGTCSLTSPPLNYNILDCKICPIDVVTLRDIRPVEGVKYCAFNAIFEITSSANLQVTLNSTDNNVVFSPTSFAVTTGTNSYSVTIFPLTPFLGGLVNLSLTSLQSNGENCIFPFSIDIPSCGGGSNRPVNYVNKNKYLDSNSLATIKLAPNPAKEKVTIFYDGLTANSTITLFDLTGRSLTTLSNEISSGNLDITTSQFPAGVYIVVVKENEAIISQQKLIIE